MKDINKMGMGQEASIISNKEKNIQLGMIDYFTVECYDLNGVFKWKETIKNLVTNEGLDYVVNISFDGGSQISTWFVGLKDTGAPAATDNAGNLGAQAWTEYTEYSEGTRQGLTLANTGTGQVDNVGNVASFTIASPAPDVFGVFVVDDNTKGAQSPATVLLGVGDFAAQKVVDALDTLNVTVTLTATTV